MPLLLDLVQMICLSCLNVRVFKNRRRILLNPKAYKGFLWLFVLSFWLSVLSFVGCWLKTVMSGIGKKRLKHHSENRGLARGGLHSV